MGSYSLKQELKEGLIEVLNLDELTPEEIEDDMPLFGTGLALDSIDALEIMLLLERRYGIRIENATEAREIFASINTLAEYVSTHRKA